VGEQIIAHVLHIFFTPEGNVTTNARLHNSGKIMNKLIYLHIYLLEFMCNLLKSPRSHNVGVSV